jgi:hypothetical protein
MYAELLQMLKPAGTQAPSSVTVSIANQAFEFSAEEDTGTSVFGSGGSSYGTATYYPFSISGGVARNATSFSIQGKSFSIQSEVFISPSDTSISGDTLNVSVAVLPTTGCEDVKAEVAVPVTQQGTLAPKIITQDLSVTDTAKNLDGYNICKGATRLAQVPRGAVTVKILKDAETVDTFLVSGPAAGW